MMIKAAKPFKKCSIEGCERQSKARGLCMMHYYRHKNNPNLPMIAEPLYNRRQDMQKKCTVDGCNRNLHALGYCDRHYNAFKRTKSPHGTPLILCKVKGCSQMISASSESGMCRLHYHRHRTGVEMTRPFGIKGENNPNWNGGVALYKNQREMRKNRLIVLERDHYQCVKCGKKTNKVMHIGSPYEDHRVENLQTVCSKCRNQIIGPSRVPIRNSKHRKQFGLSLTEISKALGISHTTALQLITNGEIDQYIKDGKVIKPYQRKYHSHPMSIKNMSKALGISAGVIQALIKRGTIGEYIQDGKVIKPYILKKRGRKRGKFRPYDKKND